MNGSLFNLFFQTGIAHIISWAGLDHLLFIVALTVLARKPGPALWLLSAFTLGHTGAMLLVILGHLPRPGAWVEWAILATIAFSAYRLLALGFAHAPVEDVQPASRSAFVLWLGLAFSFGLVHGLGFSSALAQMLLPGQSVLALLLPFSLGIEVGQALVAVLVLIWLAFSARQGIPYYILLRAAGLVVAAGVAWSAVKLVM